MATPRRASFFAPSRTIDVPPNALALARRIARAVLGVETDETSMVQTFILSYTHFMHSFFGRASAFALSECIFDSVVHGAGCVASTQDIAEYVAFFVHRLFPGERRAQTVGVHYTLAFENLMYDVCANVVARFHLLTPKLCNFREKLRRLRECVRAVGRLCAAIAAYLPYANDVESCGWTALATALEYAEGSTLFEQQKKRKSLHIRVLFDEICSNVLEENCSQNTKWLMCSLKFADEVASAAAGLDSELLRGCVKFQERRASLQRLNGRVDRVKKRKRAALDLAECG